MDCTVAELLSQQGRYLHNAQLNETVDTNSEGDNLDTEEHPLYLSSL